MGSTVDWDRLGALSWFFQDPWSAGQLVLPMQAARPSRALARVSRSTSLPSSQRPQGDQSCIPPHSTSLYFWSAAHPTPQDLRFPSSAVTRACAPTARKDSDASVRWQLQRLSRSVRPLETAYQ